jgi:hypothetical protein
MIAFAMLLSSGPMRLRRLFVKFSSFVVIGICHVQFSSSFSSSQGATTRRSLSRSPESRNGVVSVAEVPIERSQDDIITPLMHRPDAAQP